MKTNLETTLERKEGVLLKPIRVVDNEVDRMVVAGLGLLTYDYMSTSFSNLWSRLGLSLRVGPHQLLPFEVTLRF
jgi:hypothetical protein